ncbi:MAG: glycyl-radical enzyme activating protein [Bacteroidales bacterium]|nr:glycyl-radical enzyme activating protein [Bacteroidales bacterium]
MKGLIFNIIRYAINDGPGIRVTFFMKGCPLSCWWCHNPEGISPNIEEVERIDKIGDREFRIKETVGKYYTVNELLDVAMRDFVFIEESGGGVTFSGGEPLLQVDFLVEALNTFKSEGIHTAVDTSGYASVSAIDAVIPFTDLFLFDIKHLDPLKHKKYTGVSNNLILKNFDYIITKGKKVIIRIPVIPGFNDDPDHLKALRDFVLGKQGVNIERIDLLPFHRSGVAKYRKLSLEDKMKGVEQPSTTRMDELKKYFFESGINVKVSG